MAETIGNIPEEKRQFPRLIASVEVEYSLLGKEKTSLTKNISAGGFSLIVYERIEPKAMLSLKIRFPDTDYIVEAEGRVVWSSHFTVGADIRDRYDLGIEFTKIKEVDRQKISQYVFRLIK